MKTNNLAVKERIQNNYWMLEI